MQEKTPGPDSENSSFRLAPANYMKKITVDIVLFQNKLCLKCI